MNIHNILYYQTEIVDMQFVMKYEELRSKHPVFIKYGLVRPCYVKLEQTQDDSAAFLNDDPMVVLMEYMRWVFSLEFRILNGETSQRKK